MFAAKLKFALFNQCIKLKNIGLSILTLLLFSAMVLPTVQNLS